MFHIATEEEILEGKTTDVYFQRALRILKEKKINPCVTVEITTKSLPEGWDFGVFAGLEEAIELLKTLSVKVWAIEEGEIFYPEEPVLIIEGNYQDFIIFETALLGFLCQASGIATKAARFKMRAKEKTLISFGARRMHPSISPMIERNAYIGGCDGVATVKSASLLGETPMGTMPHSLILCFNSTVLALSAFDDVIEKEVPRIALIDTFQDEKFEALYVAEFLKERLYGIRLDTPPSRRGNFKKIIEEVRWELDLRGYKNVKIFVSGGLKEEDVENLYPLVDGFGVGTSISNAPVIDFSLDIVEIEGSPFSKKGKLSGKKDLLLCSNCRARKIVPFKSGEYKCSCGEKMKSILKKYLENGEILKELSSPQEIRKKVLQRILI